MGGIDVHDGGSLNTMAMDSGERSFDAALRQEMEYLLASETFKKSPKLSQLLAYLVGATLRGEGDTLKSYTVAVDGLGRDPDFDAQADSYPRVQVMRLRNFLASFYARYEPRNEMCIYLLPGCYRVRLAKFPIAYPDIVVRSGRRRLPGSVSDGEMLPNEGRTTISESDPASNFGEAHFGSADSRAISPATRGPKIPVWWLAALVAIILAAGGIYWFLIQNEPEARPKNALPTLLVDAVHSGSDPASSQLAMEIHHALMDGYSRSWAINTIEVHGPDHDHGILANYTVNANLSQRRENGRLLQISVTDETDDITIWSWAYSFDETRSAEEQLNQALAETAGSLGVIGRRELTRVKARNPDDYVCMLAASNLLADSNVDLRPALERCMGRQFKDPRLEAVRLTSRALLIVRNAEPQNIRRAMAEAEIVAQQAIAVDPSEPSGYFAMALLKYAQNACEAGNIYAARTFELNSYNPNYLVSLANFADECSLPNAKALVANAFATREVGDSSMRLAVVSLALEYDRKDILGSLGVGKLGSLALRDPSYLLSEAAIAAYFGDVALSRSRWAAFAKLRNRPNATPEELMRGLVYSAEARQRIAALLEDRGVIGNR